LSYLDAFFLLCMIFVFVFFFQAEDGIRDWSVTGVQTCALPISRNVSGGRTAGPAEGQGRAGQGTRVDLTRRFPLSPSRIAQVESHTPAAPTAARWLYQDFSIDDGGCALSAHGLPPISTAAISSAPRAQISANRTRPRGAAPFARGRARR